MNGRRRDVLLFVLGAALAALTILRGIGPHDEGLMLQAGERIADGQWPYRDFWTNYLPGQALVLGALSKIFGPSLLVWRIVRVAVAAVTALLVHRLALREEAGRGWALAAWAAAAGAMAFAQGPGPTAPALALALAALLTRSAVAGGALAGLAFFFRPEIGVAATLGLVLRTRRRGAAASGPDGGAPEAAGAAGAAAPAGGGGVLQSLAAALLVGGLLVAPFAVVAPGALADQVPGFLAIQDLQRLPLQFRVPSADPNKILEALFPAILVAACVVAGAAVIAARGTSGPAAVAPLAPLALAGLAYLLGRTDDFHQLALAVPLAAILAILGSRAPRVLALACGGALALMALHGLERRAGELLHPEALGAVRSPVADGVRAPAAAAASLNPVLAEIARRTRPGEPIYVAPPRHDRVRVGNPLLYVLAGRPNATRYDVMQPGVVTTEGVQREIVADLERRRVRLVVRWIAQQAARREDNGSGREAGARIIDEHIAARFRPALRTPELVVLIR